VAAAGVAEEDADLAVLDPPRRARVLPLHPGRLRAFLDEAGLVQDQHGIRVAQVLHDVGVQVIADRVGVPACATEEVLHAVGRRIACRFGQLPAVLALHGRQQATQVCRGTPPRLGAREPRRDPPQHRIETARPASHLRSRRHATSPPDRRNAQPRL
jgi:hypothetical protein